jgi:hypothetical protein
MSKIEQIKIPIGGLKYTLVRYNDNSIKRSEKILWVEWDENGKFSETYGEPAIGLSLLMSPFNDCFTWLTTPVTEIIEQSDNHLIFQTNNSKYELTWTSK